MTYGKPLPSSSCSAIRLYLSTPGRGVGGREPRCGVHVGLGLEVGVAGAERRGVGVAGGRMMRNAGRLAGRGMHNTQHITGTPCGTTKQNCSTGLSRHPWPSPAPHQTG